MPRKNPAHLVRVDPPTFGTAGFKTQAEIAKILQVPNARSRTWRLTHHGPRFLSRGHRRHRGDPMSRERLAVRHFRRDWVPACAWRSLSLLVLAMGLGWKNTVS